MESTNLQAADFRGVLDEQLSTVLEYLPSILGAVAILIVGWSIARVLRQAMRGFSSASIRILRRFLPGDVWSAMRIPPFLATLVGEIVFWGALFLTVTIAIRVSGLSAISGWLDRIALYLPNLIVASAIVVFGYVLSIVVRHKMSPKSSQSLRVGQDTFAARFAQTGVIAVALVMGLDQVGVDVVLPVALLIVGSAAIAITIAISIALGARSHMSNLIGLRSLQGHLAPGSRIRVNGVIGEILELTSGQVVIETSEGRALIPGRMVNEGITTILAPTVEAMQDND